MAIASNRVVQGLVLLTASFVAGCATGHSAVARVGQRDVSPPSATGYSVVARVGQGDVSATSAMANMVYVRSGQQAATFEIDAFKFSVDATRVLWGSNQSLALPAKWKHVEFVDRGSYLAVRVDGRDYAQIRPAA